MQPTDFQPRNPDFLARTTRAFIEQEFMGFLGARLDHVGPGEVDIRLPWRDGLSQQHGYFHGGAIGAIADVAGGFAAFSLLAARDSILTVEYKVNMLAPGMGEALIARGRVLRPGRRLSVAEARIFSLKDGHERLCATALGTFMTMADMAAPGQRDQQA